jgi:hypothetical protein
MRARKSETSRRRALVPWDQIRENEPDEIPAESEQQRRYLAAMSAYPKCACGQPLWGQTSLARGFCDRCRLDHQNADAPESAATLSPATTHPPEPF